MSTSEEVETPHVYSVPGLFSSAGLTGQVALKKRLGAIIEVFGTVHGLKAYTHKAYFSLCSGGEKVTG